VHYGHKRHRFRTSAGRRPGNASRNSSNSARRKRTRRPSFRYGSCPRSTMRRMAFGVRPNRSATSSVVRYGLIPAALPPHAGASTHTHTKGEPFPWIGISSPYTTRVKLDMYLYGKISSEPAPRYQPVSQRYTFGLQAMTQAPGQLPCRE